MLYTDDVLNGIIDTAASSESFRNQCQAEIDALYTDNEQSVLWQCMENKPDLIQEDLTRIIRNNLNTAPPAALFRGISKKTMEYLEDFRYVGATIEFNRVMSFSRDWQVARNFASYSFYGTRNIFCINNAPYAYNYQEAIFKMICGAPPEEFNGAYPEATRKSNLHLVNDEDEFMFPAGTTLRVDLIETHPLNTLYTVWHLTVLN